jgi:NET1-associated nuclear protein 1 (U3 small nucleolar RNA-associated protein 17)
VSLSGEWMATVDDREGGASFRSEIYLKIWRWDRKSGFWILNTRVDRPHGSMKVTSISFNTSEMNEALQLVTTGQDGQIKLWGIRTTKSKNAKNEGKNLCAHCIAKALTGWNRILGVEVNT